ncbi:MAG: 1-deoxy-D-xylulose-5-phosphate synthase [Bacteroidales bacterium]|nr:1-deoxy-D-xylulose-5-phosphate synthase [Bacteroidales bacterium]
MILEKINSPADLKALDPALLPALADEVRQAVLNRVSLHGGHVGPNLGFVEATIALHRVFNAPEDKFVFDVSHQSYPHKILTGRAFGFLDPTRLDEVSGYSSPAESPLYDTFELGHTSTSIALASGLQKGRDIMGRHENVVAVIGDGSLSGGEAFEGLDVAAENGTNIIIVVNDNEMSIAENHGGLYQNLALLRQTNGAAQLNFFKALGFDYLYVEQGNDVHKLIEAFQKVKDIDHPVVVHIHTLKGKGYEPAVLDKERWHWSMPFDTQTAQPRNTSTAEDYSDLVGQFLLDQMKTDPSLVAVTAGTPSVAGFTPQRRAQAGRQHVDVGIAEEEAVALISGMAKAGAHPVFNVYSTFIQRAYDQLAQDLCINNQPAVINVFMGSVLGFNDITHIGFYDIPMLSNIPNLTYLAPASWEEFVSMERWAIAQSSMPVAIRVPGGAVVHSPETFPADYSVAPKARLITRGSRVALIGAGASVAWIQKAADTLRKNGIQPTLISQTFLSSLDEKLLESLLPDHQVVLVAEDGSIEGGFGQKIAAFYGNTPMRVLCNGVAKGLYDRYSYSGLLTQSHLTPDTIAADILRTLSIL